MKHFQLAMPDADYQRLGAMSRYNETNNVLVTIERAITLYSYAMSVLKEGKELCVLDKETNKVTMIEVR